MPTALPPGGTIAEPAASSRKAILLAVSVTLIAHDEGPFTREDLVEAFGGIPLEKIVEMIDRFQVVKNMSERFRKVKTGEVGDRSEG